MKRYLHKKRGTTYHRLGDAPLQCAAPFTAAEGAIFTVYMSEADGKLYVRPINEFDDGRFQELAEPGTLKGDELNPPPEVKDWMKRGGSGMKPDTMPKPKPHVHAQVFAEETANTILADMLVHLFENDEVIDRMFDKYKPQLESYIRRRIERREI